MKLNITKWRPDTCGCEIDYQWDADEPAETRTHTVVNTVTCPFHTGTNVEVFDKVQTENLTKNKVYNKCLEDADLAEDVPDGKGGTKRAFRAGKEVKWSFDVNRKLEIELPGADSVKKNEVLNELQKVIDVVDVTIK